MLVCACLSLTACGSNPPLPDPVLHRVETTKYIPVPPHLTAPCVVAPEQQTIGDALRRMPALASCLDELNTRMKDIRELK